MNSLFDYALKSISSKNLAIGGIFCVLVWLLSSATLISTSLKNQLQIASNYAPQIVLNKQIAGRYVFVDSDEIDELWQIKGVSFVKGRVWGQIKYQDIYLTLLGVEPYEQSYHKFISDIATNFDENNFVYLSKNMKKLLNPANEMITLKDKKLKIAGIYKNDSELFSNDVLMVSDEIAREILGIKQDFFSDVVLKVENEEELGLIVYKISQQYPYFKTTTKDEVKKDYELLYQYKNAWFMLLYLICFFAFGIILYDNLVGMSSIEKKELGILRAIGWDINHVILVKLLQSLIVSIFAFILGLALAIFYVFYLQAPILRELFSGYVSLKSDFKLDFVFEFKDFFVLFFSTISLFVATSIIPSWKAGVGDLGKILK